MENRYMNKTKPNFDSKQKKKLGILAHTCNFSTWEVGGGGSEFMVILSYIASFRQAGATWVLDQNTKNERMNESLKVKKKVSISLLYVGAGR